MNLIADVEAFLRAQRPGVADPGHAFERRLEPYRRYVVHKSHMRAGDFYVGRPTRWGNPHRLTTKTPDERRRAVLAYARELVRKSPADRAQMLRVIRRVIVSQNGRLACWCAPELCHAQVLAAAALGVDVARLLADLEA